MSSSEIIDPVAEQQQDYLRALEETGSQHEALKRTGLDYRVVKGWCAKDPTFRADRAFAMETARIRVRHLTSLRVLDVVLNGKPVPQTCNGRPVYDVQRHPCGQPILDPQLDAEGKPRVDDNGNPRKLVPRLKLDEHGDPIPIVTREYAERTTLQVAQTLGILLPPEDLADVSKAKDGNGAALLFPDGTRVSLVDTMRARFEATKGRTVPAEEVPKAT